MTRSGKTQKLKLLLFQRDGWETIHGWHAICAFECGYVITWDNATIDHWPIPRRLGGTLIPDNTRLACFPCNSHDGGNKVSGAASQLIPRGLTSSERKAWWREQEANGWPELTLIVHKRRKKRNKQTPAETTATRTVVWSNVDEDWKYDYK